MNDRLTTKKNLYLWVLILISLGMGVTEVILGSQGGVVSDTTQALWLFIFLVMSILWAVADTRSRHVEQPFDFDFLMYVFWPIALPYYLISTRGSEGMLMFLGFVLIGWGPWLAGVVAYVYFYSA